MKGDSRKSISFLKKWAPEGPWMLTAISPDRKGVDGGHFGPHNEAACLKFLEKWNGERNLYFSVNRPKDQFLSQAGIKKANKVDIHEAGWTP